MTTTVQGSQMITLYRAHRTASLLTTPTEGWCLTDDRDAALRYGHHLATVAIDLDALTFAEVGGYDHEANETPADSRAFRAAQGVDVIGYDDETERGEPHYTWRLASDAAVAACCVVSVVDTRDEE